MANVSLDSIAQAFGMIPSKTPDSHRYATVASVNEDDSYQVTIDGAPTAARAARFVDAGVGDRLICVVQDGRVAAIARLGGSQPSGIIIDSELSTTSENPVQNKVITSAMNDKQETMDAATNADVLAIFG